MLVEFRPYTPQEKYWFPIYNRNITSIGLNFTLLMLSKPHVREHMGLVLCSSQMSTWWPQVAKTASFQWWSIPVYTVFKRKKQTKPTKNTHKTIYKTNCIHKYASILLQKRSTNHCITSLPCFYPFILLKTKSPLLPETKSYGMYPYTTD